VIFKRSASALFWSERWQEQPGHNKTNACARISHSRHDHEHDKIRAVLYVYTNDSSPVFHYILRRIFDHIVEQLSEGHESRQL
jgi:hypothetical protein